MASDQATEGEALPFMQEALALARDALQSGEVPVGCVFVRDGAIVARGHNTVNVTRNATRHAEMNCIDQVLAAFNPQQRVDQEQREKEGGTAASEHEPCPHGVRLQPVVSPLREILRDVDVYVTVEPCGMCAAALCQLRARSVTYGCHNDRFGGCGSVVDVPPLYGYSGVLRSGVCGEQAVQLLRDFYKGENPNAPSGKAKRKRAKGVI